MRLLLAGLLVLLASAAALGQVTGQVISVGFQRYYRPNCWTPMVISLTPQTGEDATYQIQVVQEDFDGDAVTYTTPITVTGNREGQTGRDIRKEIYFIPKARREPGFNFGLPHPNDGKKALNDQLKVWVATRNGRQIARLPIPDTVINIDPPMSPNASVRGARLILAVSDPSTGSRPVFGTEPTFDPSDGSIEPSAVRGILEDSVVIYVRPRELPESILGYDAVDAVVFCNADPSELEQPTPQRMQALREYVRQGGRLVITQPSAWEKTLNFGQLLPVTFPLTAGVQGVVDRPERTPLHDIVIESVPWRVPPRLAFGPFPSPQLMQAQRTWAAAQTNRLSADWSRARGPFRVAIAQARPGAYVARWIDWKTAQGPGFKSPYIVRQRYGLGAVTWVAQDLGDPSLTRIRSGWPQVWDAVFDWNNRAMTPSTSADEDAEPIARHFSKATGVDLGYPLTLGMEHGQRGAGLVFLVVFFFIVYWVLAGPVSYLVLAGRKRTSMSWFAFAAAAGAATLVTAGVVELVLRADPEVKHVSLVRLSPSASEPDDVQSGIGLYIADDGGQRIELRDAAAGYVSYITPFPVHPAQVSDQPEFTSVLGYGLPIPTAKGQDDQDPRVVIPFRTTLKKLQARWVGQYGHGGARGSVNGKLQLDDGRLQGSIVNNLDVDLTDVYACYLDDKGEDRILYLPHWKKGETIELQKVQWRLLGTEGNLVALPRQNKPIDAPLERETDPAASWTGYFHNRLRSASLRLEDSSSQIILPVLSFFDRFSPIYRMQGDGSRTELLRRGARHFDLSQVVAAGELAIAAMAAETPLPAPFYVQGDAVPGTGVTYFQAALPIERAASTTQAATQPATRDGPE